MGREGRFAASSRALRRRAALLLEAPHLRLWLQFFGAGVVVCQISLALLRPGLHDRLILMAANAASLVVVAVGTLLLPAGSRTNRLLPAVALLIGLAFVGASTTGLAPALGGFFVITFVYVGLTQPSWTAPWLMAPAVAGWLLLNRPVNGPTLARLPVAASLWLLLAELLSRVSAQRQADRDRLAQRAATDALTGLRNRHGLDELISAAATGDAVVFIDLDNFKPVNDLLGHEVGDQVLADLGRVALAVLRPTDVAVRYGGDELLLLLPDTPSEGVEALLHRLRRGWSASHPETSFSAGVALVGPDGGAAAVKDADAALYLAKRRGRNRTELAAALPELLIPGQALPAESHVGWGTPG